jgi:hypothetical protein
MGNCSYLFATNKVLRWTIELLPLSMAQGFIHADEGEALDSQ